MVGQKDRKFLLLMVALPAEARPLIGELNLRRNNKFQMKYYENDEVGLIVSGVGPKKAADATIVGMEKIKPLALCNIGICGSRNKDLELGTAIYVTRIHDYETRKSFFPDPLLCHNFSENGLVTHDKPQSGCPKEDWKDADLIDMEAGSIAENISDYLGPDEFHVVKVVSDYLDERRVSGKYVEDLISNNIEVFMPFINNVVKQAKEKVWLDGSHYKCIKRIEECLSLSFTEKHKLNRLFKHLVACDGLEINNLNSMIIPKNLNKSEKKQFFINLCNEFVQ